MENNPIEKCIICKKDTTYHFNDHIDIRYGYIEGAGQLCKPCYDTGINCSHIVIPKDVVHKTPNDQDLGSKIRKLYWKIKNR